MAFGCLSFVGRLLFGLWGVPSDDWHAVFTVEANPDPLARLRWRIDGNLDSSPKVPVLPGLQTRRDRPSQIQNTLKCLGQVNGARFLGYGPSAGAAPP